MCSVVDQNDYRELYMIRRRNSIVSMTSVSTDWSHNTEVHSNTTKSLQSKKHQNRRFFVFAKVLMKFLKKENPEVCKDAKAVILECEEKKKRGDTGYESLADSVRAPLKETVGSSYWKKAKGYLEAELDRQEKRELEPLPVTYDAPPEFSNNDLLSLAHSLDPERHREEGSWGALRSRSSLNSHIKEEEKTRRKRFWMLVKVLMSYLEKSDLKLYFRAKDVIRECVKEKAGKKTSNAIFQEAIKRELIIVVGKKLWRKSESHLTKLLIQKANDEANDILIAQEAASFNDPDDSSLLSLMQGKPYQQHQATHLHGKKNGTGVNAPTVGGTYSFSGFSTINKGPKRHCSYQLVDELSKATSLGGQHAQTKRRRRI